MKRTGKKKKLRSKHLFLDEKLLQTEDTVIIIGDDNSVTVPKGIRCGGGRE